MKRTIYLSITLAALGLANTADAQTYETLFRGTITSVESMDFWTGAPLDIGDAILPGYTYEGRYTTDTSVLDDNTNPQFGRYPDAVISFELDIFDTVGQQTFSVQSGLPTQSSISVDTVELNFTTGCYHVYVNPTSPPTLGGVPMEQVEFIFGIFPPLASDRIPESQVIASDSGGNSTGITFTDMNDPFGGRIDVTGQVHALLTPPVPVELGANQSVSLRNGASHRCGVNVTFGSIITEGEANVDYAAIQSSWDSPTRFGITSFDFTPVGDRPQVWAMEFDGAFNGDVTLTFCYDDALLGDTLETALRIARLADGQWELLDNLALDPTANTITVNSDNFEVFVLTVPEPSTLGLLLLSSAGVLVRRKRRAAQA